MKEKYLFYLGIIIIVCIIIYIIYNYYNPNIEGFRQLKDAYILSNNDIESIYNNLDKAIQQQLYATYVIGLKIWKLYADNYGKMIYLMNSINETNPELFDQIEKTRFRAFNLIDSCTLPDMDKVNQLKFNLDDKQKGLLYSLITVLSECAIYLRELINLYNNRETRIDFDNNMAINIMISFLNYINEKRIINRFTDKVEDISMFNQLTFPLKIDNLSRIKYESMGNVIRKIFEPYFMDQLLNVSEFLTFISLYEIKDGIIEKTIIEFNNMIQELNNKIFDLENTPENQLTSELKYMENYDQNTEILSQMNHLNTKLDNIENTMNADYGKEKCNKYMNSLLSKKWKRRMKRNN